MRWSKILNETDDKNLTFKEFLVQSAIVGAALTGAFLLAAIWKM